MAHNYADIAVPPSAVFEVLADARSYADWVVGAKEIRSVEGDWPAPGSKFHHSVGVGPLTLSDSTAAVSVEPSRCLVLEARARPIGVANVTFRLDETAGGTRVELEEHPIRPLAARLLAPVLDPLVHRRNTVTLDRLKQLAEGRAGARPTPGR